MLQICTISSEMHIFDAKKDWDILNTIILCVHGDYTKRHKTENISVKYFFDSYFLYKTVSQKIYYTLHCYKTFRRIPPPIPDDASLILLYRGKRLIYMGREFAPSGTEVFRNHRKFPAIFTMKKGRIRMVGSNSVPLDYCACPLPLDHGYHVLIVKKYTLINIKYQRESIKSNI